MKKSVLILIFGLLLGLSSCNNTTEDTLADALKISAYVFEENVSDPNERNDGTVYLFERLEKNKVRLMAPIFVYEKDKIKMTNLNIQFEYEGGKVEVISDNKDVQISIGTKALPWDNDDFTGRIFGYKMHLNNTGYMAFFPLGGRIGALNYDDIMTPINGYEGEGYIGRAYHLTANAYDPSDENSPVITARLKFVQLEDKGTESPGKSRLYSVELISYEYSDTYKMMEDD